MCEEFGCTPDIAVELPFGISAKIMALRDYAAARMVLDNAENPDKVNKTPMMEKVLLIQAQLALGDVEEA